MAYGKAGRKKKIETPEEFNRLVDEYVDYCTENNKPITWTGMAMAVGLYGRQELDNYKNYKGFSDAVKRANAIVQQSYENRLHGNSPTGAIFALKNMGWSDKQEHTVSGKDGGPVEFVIKGSE